MCLFPMFPSHAPSLCPSLCLLLYALPICRPTVLYTYSLCPVVSLVSSLCAQCNLLIFSMLAYVPCGSSLYPSYSLCPPYIPNIPQSNWLRFPTHQKWYKTNLISMCLPSQLITLQYCNTLICIKSSYF